MQVTETLSDGLKRAYTVVVPAADIESRRAARLAGLSKSVRLPGFRPGKIPMPVIRQRYAAAVTAEVLDQTVNESTRQMMEDKGLRPVGQPKVDLADETAAVAIPAVDLEFKLEMELLPEIALPDFAALKLTRLKAEVPSEEIDKVLNDLATRMRDLVELTDEEKAARGETLAAIEGDVLTVDFLGKLDGEPFEGGAATDADVEIGGGNFIPGFAEQLTGATVGEARTITVTFPADYNAPNLAGKEATFDITVKQLRKPVPAALDDALAQKIGMETLEELRTAIGERNQGELDRQSRFRLKRQLLDVLADMTDFPSPESIATQEFDQIWAQFTRAKEAGEIEEADKGKDEDTLRAEYRAIAERRVRLGLLLSEIGRINGLSVTQDEMNRAMRQQLSQYPGQEAQMMEFFQKYPQMTESLRGPIMEDKIVDFVLELASITDEIVSPEELAKEPPDPRAVSQAGASVSAETAAPEAE